jgi:hypothetical protein
VRPITIRTRERSERREVGGRLTIDRSVLSALLGCLGIVADGLHLLGDGLLE